MSTEACLSVVPDPAREGLPLMMPHNTEAEAGLLGVLMVNNRALEDVVDLVCEDDFFNPVHGRIFSAIRGMVDSGNTASPVTLKNQFERDLDLEKAGGAGYLVDLATGALNINGALEYAGIIHELRRRRDLIEITEEGRQGAWVFDRDTDSSKVAVSIEERLFTLAESGREKGFVDLATACDDTLSQIEAMQKGLAAGFQTGISSLDSKTGGLYRKEMTVLGARPGMGKSAMLCSVALNMAMSGVKVGIFSLEMSAVQLVQRILARMSSVPVWKQRREGMMSTEEWRAVTAARQKLAALPLFIDDCAGLSAAQIRSRARRLKRRKGLDCVFVDFLQKLNFDSRYANKTDKIGEATGILYNAAKDLDFALVLLSQLNRGVEGRDDKRPNLEDLRDSGEIEQDANNVWFLFREEYYLQKGEPKRKSSESDDKFADRIRVHEGRIASAKGHAEIIIAKSRQEETGKIDVGFSGPKQVFYDLNDAHAGQVT